MRRHPPMLENDTLRFKPPPLNHPYAVTSPPILTSFPPRADRRVGVLTNPGSLRNRSNIDKVRQLLRRSPHILAREAQTPAQINSAIHEFAEADIELLILNTGDGGIGLTLGSLLEQQPFSQPPMLSLIRGGNTNMDAGDVGQPEAQLKALEKVLLWSRSGTHPGKVMQRPVLKVRVGDQGQAHYGMFFGAGAIIKGIEYCHEAVHSKGFVDSLGPGLCTLRVLLAMARGDPSFVAPVPMQLTPSPAFADGLTAQQDGEADEAMLIVAVSTLERLFMGLKPWWGSAEQSNTAPLKLSTVHFDASHKARSLPGLLWGRQGRLATPQNGYRSAQVDELHLLMDGPITLDGEIHHARRAQGPIHISNGGTASFVVI